MSCFWAFAAGSFLGGAIVAGVLLFILTEAHGGH